MAQSTVRLIVDAQNAIRPLQRTNDATKELSKNTDKLKKRLGEGKKQFNEFGNNAKKAGVGVGSLTKTIRNLAAAFAVVQTGKFIFFKTAELETQRKGLEQLTGSVEKTNNIITELQEFSAVTPFTSSELIEQTKRLKAFGFETEELVDTTQRLADVAGATGADLTGIATAFGQIRAKGKLQQEENLQLLERGVNITDELKKITKLQGDEFESAMRKGKIGADLVNQALINLTSEGAIFAGGATKQADTLNGKLSTLQDTIDKLAIAIGTELEDEIKGILDISIQAVKQITNLVESIGLVSKLGKKDMVKIEVEAREFATKEVSKNFGFFERRFSAEARKEFQKLFELKKQDLITDALKTKEFEDQKNIQTEITETFIGRPPIQNAIIEKDLETVQNLENQLSISDAINMSLDGQVGLITQGAAGLDLQAQKAEILKNKFDEIGQSVEDSLVQNLTDAVMGAKSLGDALSSVLKGLQRQLVEMAMQQAVSGLGGFISKGLGSMFGGGGGGLDDVPFMPSLGGKGFANGGNPPVGKASLVGEKGPEIFVPQKSGTIIPNHALGGSTNVVVNVDASGSSAQGDEQSAIQLGELIGAAVQSEIAKQQMDGGLLS